MCGRFTQLWRWRDLAVLAAPFWSGTPGGDEPTRRYNIAPTQEAVVLRHGDAGIEPVTMRWGFARRVDGRVAGQVINARVETVVTLPMFRDAMVARRCLVPASGFYEWEKVGDGSKQPWYLVNAEAPLFLLAGLWNESAEGPVFAVLTAGTPSGFEPAIHHRMPGVIRAADGGAWLSGASLEPERARGLVMGFGDRGAFSTDAWPVGQRVNSAANTGAELIERVEPEGRLF